MAKNNEKSKKDEDQRIEIIKTLTQNFEKIKLEQASLVQIYHELSNNYANATNSVIRVASLERKKSNAQSLS